MAASRTPRAADSPVLPDTPAPHAGVFAVAYSGGRDSTALLHLSARQAQALGLHVLALHVHHGLSANADAWLAHCESQCQLWAAQGLPLNFQFRRLAGAPAAGQSVEAWAREGRYQALGEMAVQGGASLLLLAQHRRDQAETWLLQALRGAGAAGLAAMPARQTREHGLVWARPWLDQPREAVEAYLAEQGLSFIDDDSNADARYARNRLRLQVWPGLSAAFPGAEAALSQSAQWAQQALELQRELVAQDLPPLCSDQGLDVAGLLGLSPARASNALRAWLHQALGQAAPASLVQRLLAELPGRRVGAWPCGAGELRLYRERLALGASAPRELQGEFGPLDLSRPGFHALPAAGGGWWVEQAEEGEAALPASLLRAVLARSRQGGEQFQSQPRGVPRSLKKCFQAAAVPAWQRSGPLLFAGDRLLWVPGLGADARARAEAGAPGLKLRWQADSVPAL
jgi:tRNA(Ile)-lysidine synthase